MNSNDIIKGILGICATLAVGFLGWIAVTLVDIKSEVVSLQATSINKFEVMERFNNLDLRVGKLEDKIMYLNRRK